jgi:rSAM/selenodomain-associated transferase 1
MIICRQTFNSISFSWLIMKKALLIFAKQPQPGTVKTRLIPALSPQDAATLYNCMMTDTLAKMESLQGVDKLLFFAEEPGASAFFHEFFPGMQIRPQTGKDLGERMEAAFHAAYSMGYRAAVVIGTDSPDLPVAFIEEAFRILDERRAEAVFGPSEDGGYYLLALRRPHNELFHGIHWSTGEVLRQSLEKAECLGLTVAKLPIWHDIDTVEDLARPEMLDVSNCAPLTRQFLMLLDVRLRDIN